MVSGHDSGDADMISCNTNRGGSRDEEMVVALLSLLSEDPRIRILRVLASQSNGENAYVSFRAIARRTGINYGKLKDYLSQLVRIGMVESIVVRLGGSYSGKGYTYYRIKEDAKRAVISLLERVEGKRQILAHLGWILQLVVFIYAIA